MLHVLFLVAVIAIGYCYYYYIREIRGYKNLDKVPGPTGYPIIGDALSFKTSVGILEKLTEYQTKYGGVFKVQIGPVPPFLVFADPKSAEFLLGSNKILDKSQNYKFLYGWLGKGLLTSTGKKWKLHRRIITPTFHFKILEDFVSVFNSCGKVLIEKLQAEVGKNSIDVFPFINLLALDVICETAMGVSINAQSSPQSEYVRNVKEICRILMVRWFSPIKLYDIVYRFSNDYRREQGALKVMHNFTNSVIRKRKEERKSKVEDLSESNEFGIKRKRAFLDMLLDASEDDIKNALTDEELREEVDTFMFEGHDTTTVGMCFALFCLAEHPDVQEKVVEELNSIFSDNPERDATFQDLQDMTYLEVVLKESLRLYPVVPFFSRMVREDTEYNGIIIPKGTDITLYCFGILRDPKTFPDPLKFDPERFLKVSDQSPYAHIPFSAGPRNCIGQRFAMMEMKTTISKILRNFKLLPANPRHEPILAAETVLKAVNGVRIQLKAR